MRVLIYTANFGGRDDPYPQYKQVGPNLDVEYRYYTNDAVTWVPPPWEVHNVFPISTVPNMAAKWWRTHPPLDGFEYAIWLDANMELRIPTFASLAIDAVHDGIAVWRHPRRDCIVDEAEASLGNEGQGDRYAGLPLRQQVQSYLAEGFPRHHGLYATGTTVWTPKAADVIGDEWYEECERWGYQDQLSFPVVCWRHGIEPGVFPVAQTLERTEGWWANEWMLLHDHRPGTG